MDVEQSRDQIADLFLTDQETNEDLVICSDIIKRLGSYSSFEVMNTSTGEKQRITFKIEEV